jgi:hypothetical protein
MSRPFEYHNIYIKYTQTEILMHILLKYLLYLSTINLCLNIGSRHSELDGVFLQTGQNTETRSFGITADPQNPNDSAHIAINTPNGSANSWGSVSSSGPGASASSSSTISVSRPANVVNNGSNPGSNASNNTPQPSDAPSTPVTGTTTPTPGTNLSEQPTAAVEPQTPVQPANPAVENLIDSLRDITSSIQPQVAETTSKAFTNNMNWTALDMKGIDISSSSLQELYLVSTDNNIYLYNPLLGSSQQVLDGNNYMRVITKNKQLFALTKTNTISYVKGSNIYNFESCTNDLAITNLGEIYKLGCDQSSNVYPLFKLQCKFLNRAYSKLLDTIIGRPGITCEWVYQNIKAMRVVVGEFGLFYIINADRKVEKYTDGTSKLISDLMVKDISLSADGSLYVVDLNGGLFILNPSDGKTTKVADNVLTATAGPLNLPIYINNSNEILMPSQVVEFLNQ